MNATAASPKAFAVWFKELERWDVAHFRRVEWAWPASVLRPIGNALIRQIREVGPKADKKTVPIIEKISFGGAVSLSDPARRDKYKGRLFWAEAGELVYSKIRVKQGSLAVVPHEMPRLAVSAEYPVYQVNPDVADGEYLVLVLKSRAFQELLQGLSHGGSTKTRIHPSIFEGLTVPLPPLPVQRAIVRRWQEAQEEIGKARARVDALEAEIAREILKRLGIQPVEVDRLPKVFAVQWKDLERWGVEFNRYPMRAEKLLVSSKYATVPLEQVAWINPTARRIAVCPDDPVSFVPMEAVSEESGQIVQCLEKPCREVAKGYTRFANDDVIWAKITPCMQNGKSAIGRNLVNGLGFGSTEFHVVRTKDARQVLPGFVWVLLRLDAVRKCAQRYFIGSAGQQRVPPSFLSDLRIPLPPSAVQREIVGMVTQKRAEVAREREAAAKLSAEVTREVEAMILGARPVKGAKA